MRRSRAAGAATVALALVTAAGCGGDGKSAAGAAGGNGMDAAGAAATGSASPGGTSTGSGSSTGSASPGASGPGTPGGGSASSAPSAGATAAPAQLPRGGRTILPTYRLVGFAGRPNAEELGQLGVGKLSTKGREIERQAKPYAVGRKILPVFELIATLTHRSAGKDGMYRSRSDDSMVRTHLTAARQAKGLLLLNIQPGRADFLTEVKAYEKWLREPDVGVALDPEWAMRLSGGVPGKKYGKTTGAELDGVAAYLSAVVAKHNLPEKVMVFHQVSSGVVVDERKLRKHPGVVVIKSVDGIGNPAMKRETWQVLTSSLAPHVKSGFKLFYREDTEGPWKLMTPREVLALRPMPDYVMYE